MNMKPTPKTPVPVPAQDQAAIPAGKTVNDATSMPVGEPLAEAGVLQGGEAFLSPRASEGALEVSGDEPVAVNARHSARNHMKITARFNPQVVIDGRYESAPNERAEFDVTDEVLALGREKALMLRDDHPETDAFKDSRNAPQWVKDWEGPFYISMDESIAAYFETATNADFSHWQLGTALAANDVRLAQRCVLEAATEGWDWTNYAYADDAWMDYLASDDSKLATDRDDLCACTLDEVEAFVRKCWEDARASSPFGHPREVRKVDVMYEHYRGCTRLMVSQDDEPIGCIDGEDEDEAVWITVKKDLEQPFDYWTNSQPIARWKRYLTTGEGRVEEASAWCRTVFGAMDLKEVLEQLSQPHMTPVALKDSIQSANLGIAGIELRGQGYVEGEAWVLDGGEVRYHWAHPDGRRATLSSWDGFATIRYAPLVRPDSSNHREYLADGRAVEDALPVCVGNLEKPCMARFSSIKEAEDYIVQVVEPLDPEGVEAGNYHIDAPEGMER